MLMLSVLEKAKLSFETKNTDYNGSKKKKKTWKDLNELLLQGTIVRPICSVVTNSSVNFMVYLVINFKTYSLKATGITVSVIITILKCYFEPYALLFISQL